jgi:hypothetical protein
MSLVCYPRRLIIPAACCFLLVYDCYCLVLLLFIVDEQPKVSHNDKAMVRDHILVFLVQVPPLLRYNCVISTVLLMILIFTFWEFSLSLSCFAISCL